MVVLRDVLEVLGCIALSVPSVAPSGVELVEGTRVASCSLLGDTAPREDADESCTSADVLAVVDFSEVDFLVLVLCDEALAPSRAVGVGGDGGHVTTLELDGTDVVHPIACDVGAVRCEVADGLPLEVVLRIDGEGLEAEFGVRVDDSSVVVDFEPAVVVIDGFGSALEGLRALKMTTASGLTMSMLPVVAKGVVPVMM